jgi:hypothetical protein
MTSSRSKSADAISTRARLGDVQLRNVGMPIPSSKQILSGEGFRLRRARKYSMARRRFSAHQNRPTSARQNGPTCAIGISVCGEAFKVARGRGWVAHQPAWTLMADSLAIQQHG